MQPGGGGAGSELSRKAEMGKDGGSCAGGGGSGGGGDDTRLQNKGGRGGPGNLLLVPITPSDLKL